MNSSNRIIVNTVAQYTKTIINIVLSLYSSRLVLLILGDSDFGIYSLVAGIVALLSFLTNSMVMSTQRFLSINQGNRNESELRTIFNNSLILHLLIGCLVVLVFALFTNFLFDGFLNIPSDRIQVSRILYFTVIVTLFLSLQTSPYKALLVSHENIIYTSIIDVIDGILKLILVLLLPYFPADSLMTYGFLVLGIQVFNFCAYSIYSHMHYKECVFINLKQFDIQYAMQLARFTGWVTLSSFCLVGRNQGFAVVINKLMATTANAAYGIANQISGYLNFLSSSLTNSVAPQLMQAVGNKDYSYAIFLAKFQSKMAFLMLGLVSIPLMFEIDSILTIWLKVYPANTSLFAIMIITSSLIDQPTYGLTTMFQAIGKLAFFTFAFYGPKFLILPLSYLILKTQGNLQYVVWTYIGIEAVCMTMRLLILKKEFPSFNIIDYVKDVFMKISLPVLFSITVCILLTSIFDCRFRLLFTFMFSGVVFLVSSYYFALNDIEKKKVISIINTIKSRF